MKPEIQTLIANGNNINVSVKVSETLTISATLPMQAGGIDHLTIAQIKEAAIQHAKSHQHG